jgi:hypothetical protein
LDADPYGFASPYRWSDPFLSFVIPTEVGTHVTVPQEIVVVSPDTATTPALKRVVGSRLRGNDVVGV